jgi:hypothetical protein
MTAKPLAERLRHQHKSLDADKLPSVGSEFGTTCSVTASPLALAMGLPWKHRNNANANQRTLFPVHFGVEEV